METNLSSISAVGREIKFEDDDFSLVDTLGGYIVNREYSQGYLEFKSGLQNKNTYIWQTISALGNDMAQTVYSNVRNYIDFVSNIETCKIQALDSHMKNIGLEYGGFKNIDFLPPEILQAMNVFSIDRKYLFNSGKLGRALLSDVNEHLAERQEQPYVDAFVSAFFTPDASARISVDTRQITDERYYEYLTGVFGQILSGFLLLKYTADNAPSAAYVYYAVSNQLGSNGYAEKTPEEKSEFAQFREKNVIGTDFNEERIVDDIEAGRDFFDNYDGARRRMLEMETDRRAAKLQFSWLWDGAPGDGGNVSRYSYYRTRKTAQYVDFINNKFYSDYVAMSGFNFPGVETYRLDPNYYALSTSMDAVSSVVPQRWELQYDPDVDIRWGMVASVAKSLANTTMFIRRLRERLKLQARKNYMKGTNNLLLFVVNEYLNDYARYNPALRSDGDEVTAVKNLLVNHQISGVDVVEYYDSTEYYNISTETTPSSDQFRSRVASRFWRADEGMDADHLNSFYLQQIDRFYLSTMMVKDGYERDLDHADLTGFLDAVYDFGANCSYIDKNGVFSSKLETGKYSSQIYDELSTTSSYFEALGRYIDAGYRYPEAPVSAQIQTLVSGHIQPKLEKQYLSAVSVVHDAYSGRAQELADRVSGLSTEIDQFMSGDYLFYFGDQGGGYDYLIGNPAYGSSCAAERIGSAQQFMQRAQNFRNHRAIDAVSAFIDSLDQLSADLEQNIVERITEYGYDASRSYETFDDETSAVTGFLNEIVQQRRAFVERAIENIKDQTSQCKTTYDGLNEAFIQGVANYDSGSPQYKLGDSTYMQFSISGDGERYEAAISKESIKGKDQRVIYVEPGTKWLFYSKSRGTYVGNMRTIPSGQVFNEGDSLANRCDQLLAWMNLLTYDNTYGLKNDGTLAMVSQTQQGMTELDRTFKGILEQVKQVVNYDMAKQKGYSSVDSYVASVPFETRINDLTQFVNSQIDEKLINQDQRLSAYTQLYDRALLVDQDYQKRKNAYTQLFSDTFQQKFFQDFQASNDVQKPTHAQLQTAQQYVIDQDAANRSSAESGLLALQNTLADIQTQYLIVGQQLNSEIGYEIGDHYYIEKCVDGLSAALGANIGDRTANGERLIGDELENYVLKYLRYLSAEVSADAGSTAQFNSLVQAKIDQLNYFDDFRYMEDYQIFLNYGGRDFCYYPYFNYKNVSHPSYQVHPYLWNFTAKDEMDVDKLAKTFYSAAVEDFELNNIAEAVDGYYGEFGQTIDEWRHPDVNDYTGYTTKYESSHHIAATGVSSEVVDYDGAFYPPAVEALGRDGGKWFEDDMRSIVSAVTRQQLRRDFASKSGPFGGSNDIRQFALYDEIPDKDGKITYEYAGDKEVFDRVSPYVIGSFSVDEQALKDAIDGYFKAVPYADCDVYGFSTWLAEKLPPTFYELYYRQAVGSSAEDAGYRQYIADQIKEYYGAAGYSWNIKDLTKRGPAEEAYDMYKYGTDSSGNMYILYKQYASGYATFKERRNTPGELWIRFDSHPIAFPAFSGGHPQVMLYDSKNKKIVVNNAIERIIRALSPDWRPFDADGDRIVRDAVRQFYDFQFTQDKTQMSIVSRMVPDEGAAIDDSVQMYENPWIILTPVNETKDDDGVKFVSMYQPTAFQDYIQSGADSERPSALVSAVSETPVDNYAYLGSFTSKTDDVNHVYVKKTYALPGNKLAGSVKVYVVRDCMIEKRMELDGIGFDGQSSDEICMAKFFDGSATYIDLAYLRKQEMLDCRTGLGNAVSLLSNTVGPTYEDRTTDDMNSHDVFDSDVVLVRLRLTDDQLRFEKTTTFNQNADMSYAPSYPGLSGEIRFYETRLSADDMFNIELLGRAAPKIEDSAAAVNTDVNPYFDVSAMLENQSFGMVYEEYRDDADKSFYLERNPPLNSVSWRSGVVPTDDGLRYYEWNIDLNGRFTADQLLKMRIFMYNTACNGKNPYLVADLSSMKVGSGSELKPLAYNGEGAGAVASEISADFLVSGRRAYAAGVYNQIRLQDKNESNRLPGVASVKAGLVDGVFKARFLLEQTASYDYVRVDQGAVAAAFVNEYDLTMFEDYHYLDAYGFVKIANGRVGNLDEIGDSIPDFKSEDGGWGKYYIRNRYDPTDVKDELTRYYKAASGRNSLLDRVQLSDYSCLSDIYVLQEHGRLSFKYDERSYFSRSSTMYYYPTLNTKYPRQLGQILSENASFNDAQTYDIIRSSLSDENTFILCFEDPAEIADMIGYVDIPMSFGDGEALRVFEDYLSSDASGTDNFDKYDANDVRVSEFAHFAEGATNYGVVTSSDVQRVYDAVYAGDATMEKFSSQLQTGYPGYGFSGSEAGDVEMRADRVRLKLSSACVDLEERLKVFANYAKTPSGITLYFNYFNYLNTPFVEVRDGRLYPKIVDGTYLKLEPGQNGVLDLVVQFKYDIDGKTYGVKNGTIVSYRIYNVSDDKPKFVVRRISRIERDSLVDSFFVPAVRMTFDDCDIDQSELGKGVSREVSLNIESNCELSCPYVVRLGYPNDVLRLTPVVSRTARYSVDSSTEGVAVISAYAPYGCQVKFALEVDIPPEYVPQYVGRQFPVIVDSDGAVTAEGADVQVQTRDGVVEITKKTYNVLVTNEQIGEGTDQISAYVGVERRGRGNYIDPF